MTRTVLFLLALGLGTAGLCRADEDEPTLLDIKLSDWIKMLDEGKTPKERRKAAIAIEQIGHARSRRVVPALVKALREDKEEVVRVAAARAIGRAVAKANDQAREDRKEELPKFETAREALTTALRFDKADAVREAAALALGDIGADARQAAGSLGGALKDRHLPVVRAAATALRRMGKQARDAQADLTTLLSNKAGDAEARTEAAVALGLLREEAATLVPVFKEIVADTKADERLRRACAEALGKYGKEGADAATVLGVVLLARGSSPELRLAAVTSIDQFGADGKAALSALVKSVLDDDRGVRCLTMQALGKLKADLGDQRKEAIRNLLKALEDGNSEVIVTAVETLGVLGAEGLGGDADEVLKKIDVVINREGRKVIQEAARAAREKIRPSKK
jgi:HEAT repeat protein